MGSRGPHRKIAPPADAGAWGHASRKEICFGRGGTTAVLHSSAGKHSSEFALVLEKWNQVEPNFRFIPDLFSSYSDVTRVHSKIAHRSSPRAGKARGKF